MRRLNWPTIASAIIALAAMGTAYIERGNTKFSMNNDRWGQDYIEDLKAQRDKCLEHQHE